MNEFLQSEIKQKLASVPKIICITAIADKKIISVICVSGAPHFSLLFKLVSPAWVYFLLEHITEEKKSKSKIVKYVEKYVN